MMPASFSSLDRPPLDSAVLQRRLVSSGLFSQLELLPEIGSTNSVLAERARGWTAFPGRVALTTDHQVAGRGRGERAWVTPFGASIAVSLALQPAVPQSSWTWLPLLAGLAVVRTLRRVCGLQAVVKWPNDVLVPDAALPTTSLGTSALFPGTPLGKTCGILCEVVNAPCGPTVILGIGLNTAQTRDELPVETATSVREAGGTAYDRMTVLTAVLREWVAIEETWARHGGDVEAAGLSAEVREACSTLGATITLRLPQSAPGGAAEMEELTAVAEGIDEHGGLALRLGNGELRRVTAGEVTHVRPLAT
ncbi:biotin--[acetyl-CoA-carboxylase] ligase [Micrococcales bacterium 31B]|nr:biotin--[acetyl-CoA-carboxylase] ligase [Micrococcales bacterium 31B]